MKAMILAAGLGTRLRPLSLIRPKVLTPVRGMSMLDYWIHGLSRQGVEAVIVNAFHLAEQLTEAIRSRCWPIPVAVSLERDLLGTGGGIRYALDFFGAEPFLVINGDILCDVDLQRFYADHLGSRALVSLVLHDWPDFNNVAVNASRGVVGFGREAREAAARSIDTRLWAFTGIHCIQPEVLHPVGHGEAADILDIYRGLIASGQPPRSFFPSPLTWREMGSISSYAALHAESARLSPGVLAPLATGTPFQIDASAVIAPDVRLQGYVVIGRRCHIGSGAVLEDVILWDDVDVAAGAILRRCIVADGVRVSGEHRNGVLIDENAV